MFGFFISAVIMILSLSFAGVIIDIGLTSIYAHFGWEFWPTFTVIGAIIGLIKGLSDGHWRLLTVGVFAFAGYIMATQWMLDGIILAVILAVVYSAIENHFHRD